MNKRARILVLGTMMAMLVSSGQVWALKEATSPSKKMDKVKTVDSVEKKDPPVTLEKKSKKPAKIVKKSSSNQKKASKSFKRSSMTRKKIESSPPVVADTPKVIVGFCNTKGRTFRVRKKESDHLQGGFFNKRSLAKRDLRSPHRAGSLFSQRGSGAAELSPQTVGSRSIRDWTRGPKNPGEFQPIPEEPGRAPLHEGVDMGKLDRTPTWEPPDALPGNGELVSNDTPLQRYNRAQDASNRYPINRHSLWTRNDQIKALMWGNDGGVQVNTDPFSVGEPLGDVLFVPANEKSGKSNDDSIGKPSNNKPSMETAEKIKDEDGSEDVKKDPNPEGDDPDELRSPVMERGLANSGGTGGGNDGGRSGFTVPGEHPGDDGWARHKMEITGKGGVEDPEGGAPDEIRNEHPGQDRLKLAVSPAGSAASPPDGGQGDPDNPSPPRPEM